MPYLFQVSIGPVQSFIAGARRTRDLKCSSSFLSKLASVAASTIFAQCGEASLIFPAHATSEFDVPNKILAYVEKDIVPAELAGMIERKINDKRDEISNGVFEKIGQGRFHREMAEQQIADFIEYTWAATTYSEQHDDYSLTRKRLESLIAARKNTRDFTRVSWGSSQPKSSIDGQLECVIHEEEYPHLRNIKFLSENAKLRADHQVKALRKYFDAGPHEKLSGVDLLKRLGKIEEGEERFPSTSHMAALPFLTGLRTLPEGKLQKLEQYIQKLKNINIALVKQSGRSTPLELDILPEVYRANEYWGEIYALGTYDGALLYPERFPNLVGDTQLFREASRQFQDATDLLEIFLQEVEMRPTPYYALLVADGDSMGKVIDTYAKGEHGRQRHRALSEALAQFALKVRVIIKENKGVRIYSGGDDVLALLPLHTAVQCANQLSTAFRDALKEFPYGGESPSLSAGLAIVHHLHPLGDALRIARDTEQRAKRGDKNALAITVQKRGGPPCEVAGQWNSFIKRLECQIEFCQRDLIPSGMAYELRELAQRLETELDQEQKQQQKSNFSPPHVQYAALRVFQRKLGEAGGQEKDKRKAALTLYALKRMVGLIGEEMAAETPEQAFGALQRTLKQKDADAQLLNELREQVNEYDQIKPVLVKKLADELIIARFFAEARRLADGMNE